MNAHLEVVKSGVANLNAPTTVKPVPGSVFASTNPLPQDALMTDAVSRYELDAKLESIEARMDSRVARIESSINEMQRGNLELKVELRADKAERKSEMQTLKLTIIATTVGAVIALIAGNIGLVQSMVASFESGKSSGTTLTLITEQLKSIQERIDKQRPVEGALPPGRIEPNAAVNPGQSTGGSGQLSSKGSTLGGTPGNGALGGTGNTR